MTDHDILNNCYPLNSIEKIYKSTIFRKTFKKEKSVLHNVKKALLVILVANGEWAKGKYEYV